MKNLNILFKILIMITFTVVNLNLIYAQESVSENFITINGLVKDQKSKKGIESANVSLVNSTIGTVTNSDGRFSLKIKDLQDGAKLEISHIGYKDKIISINKNTTEEIVVSLNPNSVLLDEVIVVSGDAKKIVLQAIGKIDSNYSQDKNMMTGFYRETVRKGRKYINIAEAVIDIYKTPYSQDISAEKLQIYKGRKLLSQKASDTLAVKLQGGPNLVVLADFVKNPDMLLDKDIISVYNFRLDKPTMINDRPNYTILFSPNIVLPYALYSGKLYIDKETLTFSRAEFFLDVSDRFKATAAILKKKPMGLQFSPEELSITISYKRYGERSYISYIRNEIRFKCDWKRRLFATNYTVIAESVITDIKITKTTPFSTKESFKVSQSLSDKVSNFYDENFWEEYNIIEPSESLETAINKLKKKALKDNKD